LCSSGGIVATEVELADPEAANLQVLECGDVGIEAWDHLKLLGALRTFMGDRAERWWAILSLCGVALPCCMVCRQHVDKGDHFVSEVHLKKVWQGIEGCRREGKSDVEILDWLKGRNQGVWGAIVASRSGAGCRIAVCR